MKIVSIKGKEILCPKCQKSDLKIVEDEFFGVLCCCADNKCGTYSGYRNTNGLWVAVKDNQLTLLVALSVILCAVIASIGVWVYLFQ